MANNCPICNKAGLPDCTKNIVVCPQCNSDLKAFMLLNSISKPNKSKIWTYLIIGISLLSVAFLGLFLKSNSDKKELIAKNVILNDSISKMQIADVTKEEVQPIAEKQEATIKYVVKKGDTLWSIVQKSKGVTIEQLLEANKLTYKSVLHEGMELVVPAVK